MQFLSQSIKSKQTDRNNTMMVPIKLIIARFVLDIQVLTLSLSPYIYSTPEKVSFTFFARLYLGALSIVCSSFLIYLNHNLKYNVLKLVSTM